MQYEWDEIKCEINGQKHGLSFEDAYLVFEEDCVNFSDDHFVYNLTFPDYEAVGMSDEHWAVRQATLTAIIRNSQKDPELCEFLENIALNDLFKREDDWPINPRQIALEYLLENFNDYPKTLEILNQVALNDSDEQLREFAKEKLREWETGRLGESGEGSYSNALINVAKLSNLDP